jgi:hypothetical protein
VAISFDVARDLRAPKRLVGFWPPKKGTTVPVPKAAIHKDDSTSALKNQIRTPWQSTNVDTIPKAACEKRLSQQYFQFGIGALNAGH